MPADDVRQTAERLVAELTRESIWLRLPRVSQAMVEDLREALDEPYYEGAITDDMVERAAKALYEAPDQFGKGIGTDQEGNPVTWEHVLTYGGKFPENRDHPIADEYRRMALSVLEAARNVS